jgi:hypothetical protein
MTLTKHAVVRTDPPSGSDFATFQNASNENIAPAVIVDDDGDQLGIHDNPLRTREFASQLNFKEFIAGSTPYVQIGLGNLIVDGSTTPQVFEYQVPAGKKLLFEKIQINGEGNGGSVTRDWFLGSATTPGAAIALDIIDTDGATKILSLYEVRNNWDFQTTLTIKEFFDFTSSKMEIRAVICLCGFFPDAPSFVLTENQYLRVTITEDLPALTGANGLGFTIPGKLEDL